MSAKKCCYLSFRDSPNRPISKFPSLKHSPWQHLTAFFQPHLKGWFMSALAVVAERHDLMRKLLPNLNNGAASGCHEVRLFLDGRWTAVLVDDWLPTTEKQRRPDGTGLAYARCTGKQLWVSFIEKVSCRLRSPTFF